MASAKTTTKAAATKAAAKANTSAKVIKPTKAASSKKTDTKATDAETKVTTKAKVIPKSSKTATKAGAKAAPKTTARDGEAAPKAAPKKSTKAALKKETDTAGSAAPDATAESAMANPTDHVKPTVNGITSTNSNKRKHKEEPSALPKAIKKPRVVKEKVIINIPPTQKLNVYVFGEGSNGELGLGTASNAVDVKRPRLNPNLPASTVGVVQVAVGGMHVAALTHDNKILTWGVNDQGALGRETAFEGKLKDADADDDESDDDGDSGLNPNESTPTAIPSTAFPEGTIFTEIAAGDSSTFAVTDDGSVYGWGTFRSNDGILGFTQHIHVQTTPMLIPELKKIKMVATGSNHALALDEKGSIFAWGSGQQNQLGRRVIERTRTNGLLPREIGVPRTKFTSIACGSYHSFSIDKAGKLWAWGLNNYGETGITEGAGATDATIVAPTLVKSLKGKTIASIKGGGHHSIAATVEGECLVWGRLDGCQIGIKTDNLPTHDLIYDERGAPRILAKPAQVPGIKAKMVTASTDTCIAITTDGRAYSWGFAANYQTGLGTTDDAEEATLIDNTAVRAKKLNWAGAGGQFSVLTAPAEDSPMTNGV